jgi:RNA polymerase sigma factor (sigma-70 family)
MAVTSLSTIDSPDRMADIATSPSIAANAAIGTITISADANSVSAATGGSMTMPTPVDVKKLIEDNLDLATKCVRRRLANDLPGMKYYRDDLEAEACLALVKAAQSFDPVLCDSFRRHAKSRINNHLTDVSRKLGPARSREHSLLGDEEIEANAAFAGDELPELLDAIPANLRHVVEAVHLRGESQQSYASSNGMSQPTVSRMLAEAIEMMRKVAGEKIRE